MKPALVFLLGLWLTAAASASGAQEFGRLFFTPEQRAALDARRKARVPDKPAAAPTVASPTTRLDGYVVRSEGRSTIWVNGESLQDGSRRCAIQTAAAKGECACRPVTAGRASG